MTNTINSILLSEINEEIKPIAEKIINSERISVEEGIILYEKGDLGLLGTLANIVRERKHGDKTYFNKNFHIEPTNICIYNCKFCSYVRKIGDSDAWEYSIEQIIDLAKKYKGQPVTEVHIVGGVHPKRDLHYYGKMIQEIKKVLPDIHVKGFTAVELDFMIRKAKMSIKDGLLKLKEYG